ncbi:hypothetical protein GY45DRAFT_1344952 [Cubamyces sp. BRFM 1775]|nr:hypothetical protein GY45DRAFT_1344952 [Cubamyces sp. BRFM 1775]
MESCDVPSATASSSLVSVDVIVQRGTQKVDVVKQESQDGLIRLMGEETHDHPGAISISTTFHPSLNFSGSPPDLALVSTDGVHFYVHRVQLLANSSNRMNGLVPAISLDDSSAASVSVPQPSNVLNIVLHMMYGLPCQHYLPSLEVVEAALDALSQYGAPLHQLAAPAHPLHQLLLSFAPYRPLEAFAVAAHYALEDAAVAVSSHLLAYDLACLPDTVAQKMGPVYLKRLFLLHLTRLTELRNIIFRMPAPHPPSPGCTPETQQKLTRAWALAAAQLVWDVLPSVSTSALRSLLEPIALKLDCQLCATAVQQRVQEVVYEWSSVKSWSSQGAIKYVWITE